MGESRIDLYRRPEDRVRSTEQLKSRGGFSEELLGLLRMSGKYEETDNAGKAFGVTPSFLAIWSRQQRSS